MDFSKVEEGDCFWTSYLALIAYAADLDASDSLTKSVPSGNLLALLNQNMFKLGTEKMHEIRRKLPSSKHCCVCPGTIQGERIIAHTCAEGNWYDVAGFWEFFGVFLINCGTTKIKQKYPFFKMTLVFVAVYGLF